ncbi:MAG: DUF2231 domain-containing protein [Alphaproteobacteria bacterium]
MALIEPNVHPVFVHFAVGLLFTASIILLAAALAPAQAGWRGSLRTAGDWMLFLGLAALAGAAAAGFQAFYSVAHDGPSHEAMITHRNWALATAGVFLIAGLWRWAGRKSAPSVPFALVLLVAAGLLTVTAWWGGRLVFHHGLGVASLPQASGEGHDHDHGGHDHGTAAAEDAHDDGEHDHGTSAGAEAPEASEQPAAEPQPPAAPETPEAVADAFHEALATGDEAAVRRLLDPGVMVFEGGRTEASLSDYAAHHMGADMKFMDSVEESVKISRNAGMAGDTAWVATERALTGRFEGKDMTLRSQETLGLRRGEQGWRVVHVHWSSGPMQKPEAEPEAQPETGGDEDGHGHDDGHDHSGHDH